MDLRLFAGTVAEESVAMTDALCKKSARGARHFGLFHGGQEMNTESLLRRDERLWKVLAALGLLWALFVLWGCLNETGSSGGLVLRLFPFLKGFAYTDKLVHAGLHAVLASWWWWAGVTYAKARGWRWTAKHALAVVLLCAVYGGVIELLQAALTTTRGAEWLDALANTTGASLAVLFWQGMRGLGVFGDIEKR